MTLERTLRPLVLLGSLAAALATVFVAGGCGGETSGTAAAGTAAPSAAPAAKDHAGMPGAEGEEAHDHAPGAKAHADHADKHGGQVGMLGRWHLEVARDGDRGIRVWVTDEVRTPVRADRVRGEVALSLGDRALGKFPLAAGSDGESLGASAPEPLAGTVLASFTLTVDKDAVPMDFSLPPPGAMIAPAGDDHAHAAAGEDHAHKSPHGGIVRTAGKHHLELVPGAHEVKVYVLDGDSKPSSAEGKSGRIDILPKKGDKQTAILAPDADKKALVAAVHLEEAAKDGYTVVVSVKWDGTTLPPTRFEVPAGGSDAHGH